MVNIYSKRVNHFLLLMGYLFINSAFASSLQITWADNSSDEAGFYIEKRGLDENESSIISTLSVNATSYTDNDVLVNESYCYRVIAFNQAGSSYSDETCMEVVDYVDDNTSEDADDNTSEDIGEDKSSYSVSLSHEFISKPNEIDVSEQGLFSFYEEEQYNYEYSDVTVSSLVYDINTGSSSSRSSSYFIFEDDGIALSSGYVKMPFDTGNSISFDMQSNETKQKARIYLQAGVWSNSAASLQIIAGDQTETVTLTKGYAWQYMAVDITFEGTVPVTITTDSDHGGYSSVMVAGIVFDELATDTQPVEDAIQYASLMAIETDNGTNIDISDSKLITHQTEEVNASMSEASVTSLTYSGTTSSRTSRYIFTDQYSNTYNGYQTMSWNPENGVELTLNSGEQQINTASLYFTAGVWSNETASIELMINGESNIITLSSGYSWKNYKVDIEFEGELDLQITPVDTFSGYSSLMFAGVMLN